MSTFNKKKVGTTYRQEAVQSRKDAREYAKDAKSSQTQSNPAGSMMREFAAFQMGIPSTSQLVDVLILVFRKFNGADGRRPLNKKTIPKSEKKSESENCQQSEILHDELFCGNEKPVRLKYSPDIF